MIKSYRAVLRNTLDSCMSGDERIVLTGLDVGVYGGAFGVTKGLLGKYGSERVIDFPMSEQALMGFSIGAAMGGIRPVAEIMFMDFITLAYDQILNHASIFEYLSGGAVKVPLVVRTPMGGGRGYGATHSKSLASVFMNIPCIKVVAVSSLGTCGSLLVKAIEDDGVVLFLEHKLLYPIAKEFCEEEQPLDKARLVRDGDDALIMSYSKTLLDCVEVADSLKEWNVGVLDLVSLKPLDTPALIKHARRCGRVLVVEENYPYCGVASEVLAQLSESCSLEWVGRVSTQDVPIPASRKLEANVLPSKTIIKARVRGMCDGL